MTAVSTREKPMLTAWKWLSAAPDRKWRMASCVFFTAWGWMTLIPVIVFLEKMRSLDRALDSVVDPGFFSTTWWTCAVSWVIVSSFGFAIFTHTTRLSDRVAVLEQALKVQPPTMHFQDAGSGESRPQLT